MFDRVLNAPLAQTIKTQMRSFLNLFMRNVEKWPNNVETTRFFNYV